MILLYRRRGSGDLFAIETNEAGQVLATSGPLLCADLDPKGLDYDEYWNTEIQAKLPDFVRLSKADYLELLHQNGLISDSKRHPVLPYKD